MPCKMYEAYWHWHDFIFKQNIFSQTCNNIYMAFVNARFSRTLIKLHVVLANWKNGLDFVLISISNPANCLVNWFVGPGKTMPQWKCEIKHFAKYKSLQLIYQGEQLSLFIALFKKNVFVLLWDSSLHSSFFSQRNSKVWRKGNGIYFCNFWWWMLYHVILLRKAFRKQVYCCLSIIEK